MKKAIFKGFRDSWHKRLKTWFISNLNLITGVCTVLLAAFSLVQTCETRKSSNAAITAAMFADSAYNLSIKALQENSIEVRRRFILDSINAHAQINALEIVVSELKNQFEIENIPYLKINLEELRFLPGQQPSIRYGIINLGKYPIQLTSVNARLKIYYGKDNVGKFRLKKFLDEAEPQNFISYMSNQTPQIFEIKEEFLLPNEVYSLMLSEKTEIFFGVLVDYVNLANQTNRKSIFVLKFDGLNSGQQIIANENFQIK